jgi:hypothetical protein
METWVTLSVVAAFAQTLRFALQKRLKVAGFSNLATTLVRFVYSAPLVALGLWLYAKWSAQVVPTPDLTFWMWSIGGGTTQIFATICTVSLFSLRNFAVGIYL